MQRPEAGADRFQGRPDGLHDPPVAGGGVDRDRRDAAIVLAVAVAVPEVTVEGLAGGTGFVIEEGQRETVTRRRRVLHPGECDLRSVGFKSTERGVEGVSARVDRLGPAGQRRRLADADGRGRVPGVPDPHERSLTRLDSSRGGGKRLRELEFEIPALARQVDVGGHAASPAAKRAA